ncbi:SMP-30/gluconolactonase/LRE family protein [Piscinibacter sp.]|uniref:SMP-30/gluconolactonase/LRE family protein n=1 Tax=Piscinibacter sp. TaxID=1903157 RepID=UPI0039E70098
MSDAPRIRVAVAEPALLGESPFWHPREAALYYVDIAGRRLCRFDAARGALRHWDLDSEPGSCAPCLDGTLLLAMRDGLYRFDPARGARTLLAPPPYDPAHERFNDGKCDPQGRFWAGTLYEPRDAARATLHCWTDGRLVERAGGATVANGLAWSPNGRTLYWADTKAHTIHAFDFDPAAGELSGRRVFARFEPKRAGQSLDRYGGRPDGAAVDAEGCYWVAMFEGQRLLRLAPDGAILREITLPVRCATMPCFGGADLKTVYLTTARQNRPAAELAAQPWAGCVLAFEVDVPGLPVNFAA